MRSASPTASGDRWAGRLASAEDLFGLDSGAQIGLDALRADARSTRDPPHQRPHHRVLHAYSVWSQPTSRSAWDHRVDGRHRQFTDSYAPRSAWWCRANWDDGAVYVGRSANNSIAPSEVVDDNDTFMVGLGARRIRPTQNLVEPMPHRNTPGVNHGTSASRSGRRPRVPAGLLQRFRDDDGPTRARRHWQRDWYMGFHISRKFF